MVLNWVVWRAICPGVTSRGQPRLGTPRITLSASSPRGNEKGGLAGRQDGVLGRERDDGSVHGEDAHFFAFEYGEHR